MAIWKRPKNTQQAGSFFLVIPGKRNMSLNIANNLDLFSGKTRRVIVFGSGAKPMLTKRKRLPVMKMTIAA
jgi:hypothetical protein